MRDRWVDIALISALVLIAGTIVYTLFGRPSLPKVESGATPVNVEPANIEPVEPETPDTVTAPADGIVPIEPDQQDIATQPQQTQEAEIATTGPEVAEPAEETPRAPLAEGAIDLERVGFSFVTGGVGSCNIVLEPWQHVAVSLDLKEKYPCGTEITIELNEEVAGRTSFKAIVGDSIRNAERTVNVYVGQDEPALEYGIKDGTLNP
jgi:hypothetical protein